MESILIVGSSLAKQVLENSERCGKNIDSIIFKGKVDLNLVENELKGKNKKYMTILYLSGNDILPTKLHKLDNRKHVCLDKFDILKCSDMYSKLVRILSLYTKNVIFIEPPPRATKVITDSTCSFFTSSTAERFRHVINAINTHINVGVFSNCTLLGFLRETNSKICADDRIHLSKEAITIIQEKVINKLQ